MFTKSSEGVVYLNVLTATCVIILGLNIIVYSFISEEGASINSIYSIQELKEFPFFCDDLSLSPDEDDVTFNVRKKLFEVNLHDNRYVCRFRNLTEPLQKVVERISRLQLASGLKGERYLQCGNESLREPSGHLSATFRRMSRHQTNTEDITDTIIHWDTHTKVSFISEGVEYHKGQIKVSENRFYFVYSSVLINVTKTLVNIGKMYRFCLYVCANRNGYERILLSSYKLYNKAGRNNVTNFAKYEATSLSIRGNFFITKEELLYVKVSDQNSVIRDSVGNTFGIYPMG